MVRPADHLWIGPNVPAWIPLEVGTSELDLLDPRVEGGWIATYRERFDACSSRKNCAAVVKLFDAYGKETDSIALAPFYSRPDHLEVQDLRIADNVLYFNEACQTYSRDAGGRCSSLVALDLATKKVLWRTRSLVSNNELRVVGQYVVTAYGFTGEPASISVIRRKDGALMDRHTLPGTNFEMTTKGAILSVEVYHTVGTVNFALKDFDGPSPKLVSLPATPPDPNRTLKPFSPPLQRSSHAPSLF